MEATFDTDRAVSEVLYPVRVTPTWNIGQSPVPQLETQIASTTDVLGTTATSVRPDISTETANVLTHLTRNRPRKPARRSSRDRAVDVMARRNVDTDGFTELRSYPMRTLAITRGYPAAGIPLTIP
jgi:hypothetical protein